MKTTIFLIFILLAHIVHSQTKNFCEGGFYISSTITKPNELEKNIIADSDNLLLLLTKKSTAKIRKALNKPDWEWKSDLDSVYKEMKNYKEKSWKNKTVEKCDIYTVNCTEQMDTCISSYIEVKYYFPITPIDSSKYIMMLYDLPAQSKLPITDKTPYILSYFTLSREKENKGITLLFRRNKTKGKQINNK